MAADLGVSIAGKLSETIGSETIRQVFEMWKYESELEKLKETVSAIRKVLLDADAKRELTDQERDYINELKDAVYDADDLFDEFHTLVELRQSTKPLSKRGKMIDEVRRFFSPQNDLVQAYWMSRGVKEIQMRLDKIANSYKIDPEQPTRTTDSERLRIHRSFLRKLTRIIWGNVVCNKWIYRVLNVILEISQVTLSEVNDHQKISDFLCYKLIFVISSICLAISVGEFITEAKRSEVVFRRRRGNCWWWFYCRGIDGRLFGSLPLYSSVISSAIQFCLNLAILLSKKRFFGADTTALVFALVALFSPTKHRPQGMTTKTYDHVV